MLNYKKDMTRFCAVKQKFAGVCARSKKHDDFILLELGFSHIEQIKFFFKRIK